MVLRRVSAALLLLVAAAPGLVGQGRRPELRGAGVHVVLDDKRGGIRRFESDGGQEVALPTDEPVALFRLERGPGGAAIDADAASSFTWTRGASGALQLEWRGFAAAPSLVVRATVAAERDSTTTWRIAVEGMSGVGVERVLFPRLGGIGLTERAELAVPLWMGQRAKDPRSLLSGANGRGRRMEWTYPGQMSVQFLALTRGATAGLYVATDDSLAYHKAFIMSGDGEGFGRVEIAHDISDPASASRYAPSYAVKLGTVYGTWENAVERYRAWGTKQRWARESRVATGTATPWMRETAVWVWNRGRAAQVLDPAVKLRAQLRLPVSVFWHWWHGGPYDTSFPDYLPPRDGVDAFKSAVARAHAGGVRAITYMNMRLWCTTTPSWSREGASRYAVVERDGRVREERYNVFNPEPCAPMDVSTPFWRQKYAGIADTVIKQYGIDGIYMDQAVLSLMCWNPDHGHPVGGGHYWMDGFTALASDLRRRNGASLGLAGEGGGESWLPELDAFLTLQVSQERYADPTSGWEPLPIFQAVYHEHATTYGTYGSLTYPPYDELWPDSTRPANALSLLPEKYLSQFRMEQARMFVWGMQPTIANLLDEQFTQRADALRYLSGLATLRHRSREWLQDGAFVIPPRSDAPELAFTGSRISIYAARGKNGGATEVPLRAPSVLTGAWKAKDGRVGIALASIDDVAHTVTLTLDPKRHGTVRGATLVRRDATGDHPMAPLPPGATSIQVDVPAREGVLLIVRAGR